MNKKGIPSLLKGIGVKINKLLVLIIITVISVVSVGIYTMRDLTIGYKYYDLKDNSIVAVTQEENIVNKTIEDFLNELENKGYVVASYQLDIELLCKKTVIKKSDINNDSFRNDIINSLSIDVFITELKLEDNEKYYFLTETQCNDFINKMNSIIEQKYEKNSIIDSYKMITSNSELETKINQLTEIKAKIEAEALAKKQAEEAAARRAQMSKVTSRGGTNVSRNKQSNIRVPLAYYNYISSPFGQRHGKLHTGVDFAAPAGTEIYAWKSGTITKACWSGGYGNFIIIDHGDGIVSRYGHLSGYNCSVGQRVSAGSVIGYVGTTGNSTGNHAHIEILINGQFVDPLPYFQ